MVNTQYNKHMMYYRTGHWKHIIVLTNVTLINLTKIIMRERERAGKEGRKGGRKEKENRDFPLGKFLLCPKTTVSFILFYLVLVCV